MEFREVKDHIPEEDGTINIYHCKTGKGNDRLYLTRKGSTLLCYCHHCGDKGVFNLERRHESSYTGHYDKKLSDVKSKKVEYPVDSTFVMSEWSLPARNWLEKYGLDSHDASRGGLAYSPYRNRVIIPGWRIDNNDIGLIQMRSLDGSEPKYYNLHSRVPCTALEICVGSDPVPDKLVLVEDMLSCLKVSHVADSMCLFGTNMADQLVTHYLKTMSHKYEAIVVWLDNDNTQVRKKRLEIFKKLSTYGDTKVVTDLSDPKGYDAEKIREVLWNTL